MTTREDEAIFRRYDRGERFNAPVIGGPSENPYTPSGYFAWKAKRDASMRQSAIKIGCAITVGFAAVVAIATFIDIRATPAPARWAISCKDGIKGEFIGEAGAVKIPGCDIVQLTPSR